MFLYFWENNALEHIWMVLAIEFTSKSVEILFSFNSRSYHMSIDLQNKSLDWFLHDRELHHERVNAFITEVLNWLSKIYKSR